MIKDNIANTGDIAIAYDVRGKGYPLIMIMGYTGTKDIWPEKMLDILASENKVITFDNRGFGESGNSEQEYSIELFAGDVISLLESIGADKANILGYSMGVCIALETALLHPEKVNKLILYAGSCGGKEEISPGSEIMQTLNDILDVSMTEPDKFFKLFFPDNWLKNNNPRDYMPIPEIIPEKETINRQFEALINWKGVYRKLTDIKSSTLVITGRDDAIRPPANALLLANNIPNTWLAQLSGGHGLMWQSPEKLANIILNFIKFSD